MFHAVIQPMTSTASTAPALLRKRKASDVEGSMHSSSNARLRTSLAANIDPNSPDDNGKFKAKSALDSSSPSNAKRRKSSGSADHENTAPAVDAAQQGSSGYVPLVTSFFSNVISWTTSLFSASGDAEEAAAPAPSSGAGGAAKTTRTVVQTKAFTRTPDDLINETPARCSACLRRELQRSCDVSCPPPLPPDKA
jgi:hypothetical protein